MFKTAKNTHRHKGQFWDIWREKVYLRDKGKCRYCGKELSTKEYTVDHIVPLSRAEELGIDAYKFSNLALACRPCNKLKDNMTLEEFEEYKRVSQEEGKDGV